MARAQRVALLVLGGLGLWYALGEAGGLATVAGAPAAGRVVPLPQQGAAASHLAVAVAAACRGGSAPAGPASVGAAGRGRRRRGARRPGRWRRCSERLAGARGLDRGRPGVLAARRRGGDPGRRGGRGARRGVRRPRPRRPARAAGTRARRRRSWPRWPWPISRARGRGSTRRSRRRSSTAAGDGGTAARGARGGARLLLRARPQPGLPGASSARGGPGLTLAGTYLNRQILAPYSNVAGSGGDAGGDGPDRRSCRGRASWARRTTSPGPWAGSSPGCATPRCPGC